MATVLNSSYFYFWYYFASPQGAGLPPVA